MKIRALCGKKAIRKKKKKIKKVIKKKKKKIIKKFKGWQNPLVCSFALLTWERQPQYYDWEEELVLNGIREWHQGRKIAVRRKGWRNMLVV